MASFEIAYTKYILPNEGGYANLKNDKGGRTYAGIAENFNKTWAGWPIVNTLEKKAGGVIKNNTKFPELAPYVDTFYRDRWNKNRFGEIKSQEVANFLFDYHVHSQTIAIKAVQKLVGVVVDGGMGTDTLNAINKANAAQLHDKLKAERLAFFETLYAKNPTQESFRAGWTARIAKFPSQLKDAVVAIKNEAIQTVKSNPFPVATLGIAAVGAVVLYFALSDKKNKND